MKDKRIKLIKLAHIYRLLAGTTLTFTEAEAFKLERNRLEREVERDSGRLNIRKPKDTYEIH